MWTAAVMVCMIGAPMNFMSCHVVNANYKYMTEERCWYEINKWIGNSEPQIKKTGHRVVSAKCQGWLEQVDAPDVKKEGT
jgi:predicted secreted Zn-dependent protease|tara:strand:+ start:3517 stop:3756 length:240 start_codon:yes stop_codon:yes gene_type:complete